MNDEIRQALLEQGANIVRFCEACIGACPANALLGNEWSINGGRESVVDVSKCCCALKYMVFCPFN